MRVIANMACRRTTRGALVAAVLVAAAAFGLADTGRHTIRRGETLAGIARRHGVSVTALAELNGISDPDRIIAGTSLVVPGAGAATSPATTHRVERGDTLASIARRYGTSVKALAEANGLRDPNRIVIGTRLTVPATAAPAAGRAASVSHTVQRGETLAAIARRYGTTVRALVDLNGIERANLIRIGAVLQVPGGGAGAPGSPPVTVPPAGGATSHVVSAGETAASIARRYGIGIEQLAFANGLVPPYNELYVGTRLRLVPANTAAPSMAACPVPGGRFFNDWGFVRSGGRFHEGTDLFAPRGTPVRAPVSGVVSQATGSIGGLQIRLRGDDGATYIGSHLDAFGASGRVGAGDVIGYVGDTGNARGARTHLHFEIHPGDGPAVNPYPALVAACR